MNRVKWERALTIFGVIAIIFVLITWATHANAQSADVVALNKQVIAPTVQIVVDDQEGHASGSGTVVFSDRFKKDPTHYQTLILTNFHVIASAVKPIDKEPGFQQTAEVKVRSFNYVDTSTYVSTSEMNAVVVGIDRDNDMAMLMLIEHTQGLPVARLEPATGRLDMGEEIVSCGAGLGNVPYVSPPGRVGFSQVWMRSSYYTLITTPITFGNSGGGVYRKASDGVWEFVGIPSDVSGSPEGAVWHVGFAIPMPMVYNFFNKAGFDWLISPEDYRYALVGQPDAPKPTQLPFKKKETR